MICSAHIAIINRLREHLNRAQGAYSESGRFEKTKLTFRVSLREMSVIDKVEFILGRLERALLNYSAPVMFLFIFGLIIVDLLLTETDLITLPIVTLILVLLILPYVQYIQRLRWGPFEAELDRQIEEARESVRRLPDVETPETTDRQEMVAKQLNSFLEDDPKVAVAALWIELEETLRNVLYQDGEDMAMTLHELFKDMQETEVIDRGMQNNIRNIRDLRNEALHGGEITRMDAEQIIEIGLEVLSRLYEHADLSDNEGLNVAK